MTAPGGHQRPPRAHHALWFRAALAALVAGAVALSTAVASAACRPQSVAVMHMRQPFTVAGMINGHAVNLLIDTGSYANVLTTATVTRLSLKTDHLLDDLDVPMGYALQGVGGRRHFDRVNVSRLEIDALQRLGVAFDALWSGYAAWDVDGLVGMDILGDYDLDLDIAAHQVVLYEPGTACTDGYTGVPLLHRGHQGTPLVAVMLDGRPMVALLDTGADRTVLFARGLQRSDSTGTVTGIGPDSVLAAPATAASLQIGDVVVPSLHLTALDQARPGDAELILGLDFFRRVHVITSPSTGTAWLQYPPARTPAG
jgi:predicted aspartyl protease